MRIAMFILTLFVSTTFADQLPRAEKLATPPVRTLLGYTRRVLHLKDGHTLAVFSYSGSAAANWLFLIDARDLTSKRFPIPNNDIASHAAALGSDGNIYIMPYHSPRAYRFDVTKEKFEPIAITGLPGGEYTWDAIGAKDGFIYFGTYPHACVGRYDCATGKSTILVQPIPNTTYVSNMSEDDAGGAFAFAWGPDKVWLKLTKDHPPTRSETAPPTPKKPTPVVPVGEESLPNVVQLSNTTYAIAFPSSKLYAFAPDAKICGDPHAPAEPWMLETVGDAVIGISHYGALCRYDSKTAAFTRGKLDNLAHGGNGTMCLEAVTPNCVIGGNYSQQNLFRIDPANGKVITSDNMIARTPGEVTCAVALNGKAYIGVYIHSILTKFDPHQPFVYGKNPREVGELWNQHKQTRPIGAATDGKLIFLTSESDYNLPPSGALAVYDPAAKKFDAYPNLVPGENLSTIAYDPASKRLWGGTDRWGQMHSTPPTQDRACVFAFDPVTRTVSTTLTPFASADVINVLGCPRDGLIVAASGARFVAIDTMTHISKPQQFPAPPSSPLRRGVDGNTYFCAANHLYRWNNSNNTFIPVATCNNCTMLTESAPRIWLMADATTVYRVALQK